MNLDQYKALQPRILDAQRLALELVELGFSGVGIPLGVAAMKALKIKPAKASSVEESPKATTPKAGKGA